MSHPRPDVAHTTEALTRRTVLRKAVLGAWDERVSSMWLYCLADAAQKYDMMVHHTSLVITHHHTMVTPRSEKSISHFTRQLHQQMSRGLNHLLEARGYDALGQVWDGRQPHRMPLLDAEAMMLQLVYQQLQHVEAGLVHKPKMMPGFTFRWSLWRENTVVKVPVPEVYFDQSKREPLRLKFTPPPALVALFGGNIQALIHAMEKLERAEIAKIRQRRRQLGRRVKGPQAIRRIHPWDEPNTKRETRDKTTPVFRIGSREDRREKHLRAKQELAAFRKAHRAAFDAWRAGDRGVVFPFGADKMPRVHGALEAEYCAEDAWLLAPGAALGDKVPSREQVLSSVRDTLNSPREGSGGLFAENAASTGVAKRALARNSSVRTRGASRVVVHRTRHKQPPEGPKRTR